jgi:hypothetical protein
MNSASNATVTLPYIIPQVSAAIKQVKVIVCPAFRVTGNLTPLGIDVFNSELHLLGLQNLYLVEVDKIWLNINSLAKESSSPWTFAFGEI